MAADSDVRMFTCSGTDFYDVYTGVGPRRLRETFELVRNAAPAILFVDEFDALGSARGNSVGAEEGASIINELLVSPIILVNAHTIFCCMRHKYSLRFDYKFSTILFLNSPADKMPGMLQKS